jgi:O-antigen/teichoic acid export membrane protein
MQVSPTLEPVMWALVAARWFALFVLLALVRRAAPSPWTPDTGELRSMVTLGGWMTVSSAMAFLMLYADRFVVGSLLSLEAVTWYAAPAEVIQRLAIVPAAMMGVLFPAFSRLLAEDRDAARRLYRRSRPAILALLAPPVVVLAVFAKPLLTAWLGPEIAARSAVVAAILAVGGLIHGLAQPPFHMLQAAGRPDIPARLHLVEAPLYVGYMLWLTVHFGINGTAAAWLLRVTISMVALNWLARRFVIDQPGSAQDPSEAVR